MQSNKTEPTTQQPTAKPEPTINDNHKAPFRPTGENLGNLGLPSHISKPEPGYRERSYP